MSKIPSCIYGYKLTNETMRVLRAAIIADICQYDIESRYDIQQLAESGQTGDDIYWTLGEVPEHIDSNPDLNYTMTTGMILLTTGVPELHTEGTSFRLYPGTIFRIDHSKKHRVYVDDLHAPFAFLAWDHPRKNMKPMRVLAMEMAEELGRRTARFHTPAGEAELKTWEEITLEKYRDAPYDIDIKTSV
jgi:hypothetical protein